MSRANLELGSKCVLLVLQLVLGGSRFASSQAPGGRWTARQEAGGRWTARRKTSATQTRCQGFGQGCQAPSGQVRGIKIGRRPLGGVETQLTVYGRCAALESFAAGAITLAVEAPDHGPLVFGASGEQSRSVMIIAMNDGSLVGAVPLLDFEDVEGVQRLGVYRVDDRSAVGVRVAHAAIEAFHLLLELRVFERLAIVENCEEIFPETIAWCDKPPYAARLADALEIAEHVMNHAGIPLTAAAQASGLDAVQGATSIFGGHGRPRPGCGSTRGGGRSAGRGSTSANAASPTGRCDVTAVSGKVDEPRQEIALPRSQSGQAPRQEPLADRDLPGRCCVQSAAPLFDRRSQPLAAGAAGDLETRSRQMLDSQGGRVVPPLAAYLQPGRARPSGVGATSRADQGEKEDQLLGEAPRDGDEGKEAMRPLEVLTLKKVRDASRRVDGRGSSGDVFELFDEGDGDDSGSRSGQCGSESLMKIIRSITNNPAGWNDHFDSTIEEQLFAGITGKPWSLHDYVLQRMRFTQAEEDFERSAHIFAGLHAIHRRGPDSYEELGAAIRQGFKALEQGHRDRSDWTLAWLWTNLPDPKPPRRFARELAHPSEHSAGVAYIREMQTLQGHHGRALDDDWRQGRHGKGKKDKQGKGDYGHKGERKNLGKDKNGGGKKGKKGGDGGRGGDGPPAQ
jgi:hypothetical protein